MESNIICMSHESRMGNTECRRVKDWVGEVVQEVKKYS